MLLLSEIVKGKDSIRNRLILSHSPPFSKQPRPWKGSIVHCMSLENSGPLQQQCVLLTTRPSLQSAMVCFFNLSPQLTGKDRLRHIFFFFLTMGSRRLVTTLSTTLRKMLITEKLVHGYILTLY